MLGAAPPHIPSCGGKLLPVPPPGSYVPVAQPHSRTMSNTRPHITNYFEVGGGGEQTSPRVQGNPYSKTKKLNGFDPLFWGEPSSRDKTNKK